MLKERKELKSCAYYLGMGLIIGTTLSNIIPLFIENYALQLLVRLFMPTCCVLLANGHYSYRRNVEHQLRMAEIMALREVKIMSDIINKNL